MTITDPMREATQVSDVSQLISFENQIVVAETVKFCETRHFLECAGRAKRRRRFRYPIREQSKAASRYALPPHSKITAATRQKPYGTSASASVQCRVDARKR